jgi:hypothetical protein|tara:strand:- start:972 stop:2297 length:1326 start_codon:yes stop_codon:yes gene_type:complete
MKMNKILLMLAMLLFASTAVVGITPDFTMIKDTSISGPPPLFISRTDPDQAAVQRGELLNARYEITWTEDSSESAFAVYYIVEAGTAGEVHWVTNAYYDQPVKSGKTNSLSIKNLDTSVLPDKFCNTNVLLGGFHFVCGEGLDCDNLNTGVKIRSADRAFAAIEAASFDGWAVDTNHRGEIEGIGTRFKLTCPTVEDKCLQKSGNNVNVDTFCASGDVARKVYTGSTLTDGSCATSNDFIERCGSNKCSAGTCLERKASEKLSDGEKCFGRGDSVCKSGNCILTKCSSTLRDIGAACLENNDCKTNSCQSNACQVKDVVNGGGGGGNGGGGGGGIFLEGKDCEAALYCDNGNILVDCEDGIYGKEQKCEAAKCGNCKKHSLIVDESDDNICQGLFDTFENGECKFDLNVFVRDSNVWIGGSVMLVIIIIIVTLLIVKKKKK